jgi:formate dehydrogenase major subunit
LTGADSESRLGAEAMFNDKYSMFAKWPVLRQIQERDVRGLGRVARSDRTDALEPRTKNADRVVKSICPYCAVGCGQDIYLKDGKIIDIEGDHDSPISAGRLCPKGSASFQLVTGTQRAQKVLYRRPHSLEWEALSLDTALGMVARRVKATRDSTWERQHEDGYALNRTLGIAHLGGATLDNEENYLIKKLFTGLGIIQIENQARI